MEYDAYIKALADLLSGEPDRVRRGNEALFKEVIKGADKKNPLLALADAADQG